MEICRAEIENAVGLAGLHKNEISSGFLSSTENGILYLLYKFLIAHEIVFVAKEGDRITWFISCAVNKGELYKQFILRNFIKALPFVLKQILSWKFITGFFENITSVFKSKTGKAEGIPELLSIVVKKGEAGKGTGSLLLEKLEEELKKGQHGKYQVIAGDKLVSANKFYKKHGFQLVKKIQVHKGEDSNLYIKILK